MFYFQHHTELLCRPCLKISYIRTYASPLVDIYAAVTEINFDGTKHYVIGACGMTSFGICEPTAEQNASAFASALMKIWLRFGFYHTIVVDKDSKFPGIFSQTNTLISINIHVLSSENNDPIFVERIFWFLNSCINVFWNERGNNCIALEGILMYLYAWNYAPVVGTDITLSLLVYGH